MSTAAVRVPLADADRVAAELLVVLGPACERIEVAGSVRRRRPDVGDIELVAVPTLVGVPGLFEPTGSVNRLWDLVNNLVGRPGEPRLLATHQSDPKMGERYAKLRHPASGLQVDLFTARPETFGLILLIRTGPADYSQWFVVEARRRGFHVKEGELHRGSLGCGAIACERIPVPEERHVYAALRMAWVPPEGRQ